MAAENARDIVTSDVWSSLRPTTPARIALGRAGGSLPTQHWLAFQAAHAAARNAVHASFDAEQLAAEIRMLGVDVIVTDSAAECRQQFLLRPELGRRLADRSRFEIEQLHKALEIDLSIVVSDGLSAIAAQRHSHPLLSELLPNLQRESWRLAPIVIARLGRVALQDEIGQLFGAKMAMMLIGERPGLGSPDSLAPISYTIRTPETPTPIATASPTSAPKALRLRPPPIRSTTCSPNRADNKSAAQH